MKYARTFERRTGRSPILRLNPRVRPALPGALLCILLGACSLPGGQDVGQRTAQGGKSGHPITVDELDQITKSFADRYVLLLANACDEIKKEASSDGQRRDAHRLKLDRKSKRLNSSHI